MARLMYQTALMESGFTVENPNDFANKIYDYVKKSLSINPNAAVEEEDDTEEATVEENESSAKSTEMDDAQADDSRVKDEL